MNGNLKFSFFFLVGSTIINYIHFHGIWNKGNTNSFQIDIFSQNFSLFSYILRTVNIVFEFWLH